MPYKPYRHSQWAGGSAEKSSSSIKGGQLGEEDLKGKDRNDTPITLPTCS